VADDQVVKLLEEIRDLQKESLANQQISLQNQQASVQNQRDSMAVQKRAVQRGKIAFIILGILVGFLVLSYAVPLLSWVLSLALRR
jgi:uncharacterized membrane protein